MCSSLSSNKVAARQIVRVGFGLALLFTGIAHYRDAAGYAMSVGSGLGPDWLVGIGTVWGYVLPFLFILGGLSLTFNVLTKIGVWAGGLSLASIPAGLMLKSAITGLPMDVSMPAAMNAYIWILVYLMAVKGTCGGCCSTGCMTGCACGSACSVCGNDPCTCSKVPSKPAMKSAMPAPTKSMPKKAPARKPVAKKAPVKKVSMPKSI